MLLAGRGDAGKAHGGMLCSITAMGLTGHADVDTPFYDALIRERNVELALAVGCQTIPLFCGLVVLVFAVL